MNIRNIFKPDYVHYEGVRLINIYLLRLLYFLMFVGVGLGAWKAVITYQGPWDHVRAVAWCVWVAYPTLSVFGLIKPLRWLPLVLFTMFYKMLWIIVAAYPLWRAGTLAGSPADEMAHIFIGTPIVALIVPWKYLFKNYILISKKHK